MRRPGFINELFFFESEIDEVLVLEVTLLFLESFDEDNPFSFSVFSSITNSTVALEVGFDVTIPADSVFTTTVADLVPGHTYDIMRNSLCITYVFSL